MSLHHDSRRGIRDTNAGRRTARFRLLRLAVSGRSRGGGTVRLRRAVWHEVIPGLWQGGSRKPPEPGRFDVVVSLCAKGNLRSPLSRGQRGLAWFIADADVPHEDTVRLLARQVSAWLDDGQRILVRCKAGLNRSGLVVARTLVERGVDPGEAIRLIRRRRHRRALNNQAFVAWLLQEAPGEPRTGPAQATANARPAGASAIGDTGNLRTNG